jgi:hypothetical protein
MTAKTPTLIKKRTGNPGKRKINHNEPVPKGRLVKPKSLTPLASKIWDQQVGNMTAGLYQSVDEGSLASWCEAYANFQTATVYIHQHGMFSTGSQGQTIVSPAVRAQEIASRLMLSYSAKLGFTPIDRMSLSTESEGLEDDPFAKLIQ